jgi:hypothetical protein
LFVTPQNIIDEVVEGAALVKENRLSELFSRIGERGYYTQFLASAQALAPDGEKVKHVALSSSKRQVDLSELPGDSEDIPEHTLPPLEAGSPELIPGFRTRLTGRLDQATVRGAELIGVTTDKGVNYNFYVREGMDDLVRTYFNKRVEVRIEVEEGRQEIASVSLVGE